MNRPTRREEGLSSKNQRAVLDCSSCVSWFLTQWRCECDGAYTLDWRANAAQCGNYCRDGEGGGQRADKGRTGGRSNRSVGRELDFHHHADGDPDSVDGLEP